MLPPNVQILIDEIFLTWPYDFWSFIIELVTRNPNLGIPALKDERFFANLLIFGYLQVFLYFCKGKGREGKGREKGKGKISLRMHNKSCLGTSCGLSYDHIV